RARRVGPGHHRSPLHHPRRTRRRRTLDPPAPPRTVCARQAAAEPCPASPTRAPTGHFWEPLNLLSCRRELTPGSPAFDEGFNLEVSNRVCPQHTRNRDREASEGLEKATGTDIRVRAN